MYMNDNKTEYVYCMSNKSFNRDLVKIGWTKNEPKKRKTINPRNQEELRKNKLVNINIHFSIVKMYIIH